MLLGRAAARKLIPLSCAGRTLAHARATPDLPMKRLLLIASLLIAMPAGAEIYRCEVQGKPVYQDRPCAGRRGGPAVLPPISVVPRPSSAATPAPSPADAAAAPGGEPAPRSDIPAPPSPALVRAAIIENRVLPGMREEEVLAAAGRHTDHRTEAGSDAQGAYVLWVFSQRLDSFPFVVKLRDGTVVETRGR